MNEASKPLIDLRKLTETWLTRVDTVGPVVEAEGEMADKKRELTKKGMSALHSQKLFRLLLAKHAGGEELPLPVFFNIIEQLATYDGSAAWCVAQGNGCAMLGAYLASTLSENIWGNDPSGILAWGPGKAEATAGKDGYKVTAKNMFVSGSHHATWLAAHCSTVFEKDGKTIRVGKNETPENRTVIIRADETTLTEMWDVVGLRGTGSDGFELKNHFVPDEHTIVRATMIENTTGLSTLYNFSTMAIYGMGFAATALGLAQGFLANFLDLAQNKKPRNVNDPLRDNPVVQDEVARTRARLSAARSYLIEGVESAWQEAEKNGKPTLEQRMEIRLAATHAIHEAKSVVDILFDTGGTSSILTSSPFERRFRDIHTVALQIQGRKTHFQTVGEWLLGHAPNMNVV